ncbi:hypothetical protein EYC84_010413 [Monilinia fructicola]|uniref:Calcium-channel protein CCH1 n=1 Tax=Monilinia fructicola TaxID=38448 RepID=A0A5M9JDH8_MONFR|nr:hypothetical protein EYC84_010413 [Monilinia fructicola]
MPPNNTHGSKNSSSPPQSIPLRDLTRPPDSANSGDGARRRSRGRSLLAGGGIRPMGSTNSGTGYERLEESSPTPRGRFNGAGGLVPLTLQPSVGKKPVEEPETPISPVGNPADFQAAMGFAGLNVPDISLSHVPRDRSMSFGSAHSLTPYASSYVDLGDADNSYFPSDSDRIPLTDSNHLQPMSGVQPTTPDGQRHDRSSFQSISFNSPGSNYRGSRLGDDLPHAEAGLSSYGTRSRSQSYGANLSPSGRRSRSPSTVGALSRAGSMVRAMSQRVVNLSGEAEVIEESARRQAQNIEEPFMPSRRSYEPDVQDTAYRPNAMLHPFEKSPTLDGPGTDQWQAQNPPNPLRGKTLGIFSPDNKIRLKLCDLLVYPITEPAILILIVVQTVLLAVESAPSVYTHPRNPEWGGSYIDYALMGLFIVFTLEVIARIIVSGFIANAADIDRFFAPQRKSSVRRAQTSSSEETNTQRPIVNTFAQMQAMTSTVEQAQRLQLARRAFLRHSFNRLDFVAVVAYWAAFILSILGVENDRHLYIFRMLSCLRILRLLALTNGTAIILRSLKKATPLLLNVSFLIGFFWLLFAIIGIQSFKGSLDRQCVWIDPDDIQNKDNTAFVNNQYCGGSYCVQLPPSQLPYNGTVTFDNIGQSLELVFVIMTGNTFTDLMYYTTDSDYLAAAIFFAGGIVIMMLWLMNLLIAVITSSFQVIRGEGKASAFAAQADDDHRDPNSNMPRQLFRGEIPEYYDSGDAVQVNFSTIFNSFLGLYQILSSENWTTLLYDVTGIDKMRNTSWIGASFFIGWFILANFILVNMFIAVIQENFDVSEDEKRMQQVKAFLTRKEVDTSSSNLALSSIVRFGRSKAKKDPLDYGPATMEMLLKDAVVKDFLDDEIVPGQHEHNAENTAADAVGVKPGFLSSVWGNLVSKIWNREPNPFYSNISFSLKSDDSKGTRAMAKEAVSASAQRKKAQREYLAKHPSYNNALFIFKPNNPIRRLCQRCVGPGRGSERFDGVEPDLTIWYGFSAFLYLCIVAMVLLACITTPLYQREYFLANPGKSTGDNWFVFCDFVFGIIFTVEAVIKVIADGFFWTPNAYYRSTWGFIDGLVLVTLWINVITSLMDDGAIARAVGAFKALRALRLLNVSDSARNTFHSVILVGGFKVLSVAAFVSMSLLIPFANIRREPLQWTARDLQRWGHQQQVSNPWYDFDNFGGSLFILFQIVSQEGWIDVMFDSMSITGRGLNPGDPTSSEFNAVFFVIFNLLATVFILTLFISVFMRNYTEQTGIAFLTSDQRSWVELRKLLRQVSPSKRPSTKDPRWWKDWCYKRATRKHGKWHSAMTLTLVFHLILLFVFYSVNVVVRIIGLTWPRFRRSSWDMFSIFAVSGTLITTLLLLTNFNSQVYVQLHKLFLVAIVLLLIPRNDALDQLFKTAAASLTSIGNLLATWFVLFMVFAIAMTQTFGLTRFGSQETDNLNMRTVPKTLLMLFRMSCGEGWNQIMEDYATIVPPFCTQGDSFFDSDCGSPTWARVLFIAWNIVSMYIFTSLFVSLIYESFSYVFQRSNGLSKVSRDELRRFKEAWALLDPDGTGFIEKEHFPRLLGELSGVFEMHVQAQPANGRLNSISSPSSSSGVDLKALNERISKIDTARVRRDRARFNLFYEEVLVSADPDRGISFTTVLMVLAHYNVISDNKSLKLEEFLRRRARLQRVEEEVRRRIVVGFFDTMYWSRRFRKHMERKKSGRMTDIPQLGPEVYVDDEEASSKKQKASTSNSGALLSPIDITDNRNSFVTYGLDGAPLRQTSRHGCIS